MIKYPAWFPIMISESEDNVECRPRTDSDIIARPAAVALQSQSGGNWQGRT